MSLETVKTLLGVDNPKVDTVYALTEQRLLGRLKRHLPELAIIPEELAYIVDEVAIIRFNRIGSEGMSNESVEGHSATYIEDDFRAYERDIAEYVHHLGIGKGRVRFL